MIQLGADGGEEIMGLTYGHAMGLTYGHATRSALPRQRRLTYGHAMGLTYGHATRSQCSLLIA
ncbi:hypothetical protein [Moorena sp. SIO3H5]|uniref:hypothetical protein n=1 Tax=Moorena sp. SIO3H5 TaxID=2607834 RepID=UPI0013BB85EF|nr:hypothetical protein [Moorena sp. SIO3H5]NEO71208.1 hypothetical protein [Moorena sp. SIO3H5]